MRLGVLADIHGNLAALEAVLADGVALGVERWWVLGDLVLFGPRPVEVLDRLLGLPEAALISGNTDRYVLTGAQPWPHETPADAVGDLDLVERLASMAGAIGWTRGALVQAGVLDALRGLPTDVHLRLEDGTVLRGVHASPGHDDGPGIDNRHSDDQLAQLLESCGAGTVVGGHTHDPTDRTVGRVRALNPGSVGMPHSHHARWLFLESSSEGLHADLRSVRYDIEGVVADLQARGYPNAAWVASVLRAE